MGYGSLGSVAPLDLIIGMGIVIGAIQCFFGYRVFELVLGLTGFFLGALLAAGLGYILSGGEEVVTILVSILGGFIGAALLVGVYFIGVFLIGSFFGGILGIALYGFSNNRPEPAALLILAVIGGVVALIFQKFMIVVSTSFGGSWNVVTGIAYFLTESYDPIDLGGFLQSASSQGFAVLLSWIALGIVGVFVQYKSLPVSAEG